MDRVKGKVEYQGNVRVWGIVEKVGSGQCADHPQSPPAELTLLLPLTRSVPSRPSLVPSSMSTLTPRTSHLFSTLSRFNSREAEPRDLLSSRSPNIWERTLSDVLLWTVPLVSSEDRRSSTLEHLSRFPSVPLLLGMSDFIIIPQHR